MRQTISLFLLACLIGCGNKKEKVADTMAADIKTTKTDKHINVPGTRMYIVPPPGFKPMGSMVGLQKDQSNTIVVMDLVGGNYYSNAARFDGDGFKKAGAEVFDYKEIAINEYPAKYIFMENAEKMRVYSLVFGDSTFFYHDHGDIPGCRQRNGR